MVRIAPAARRKIAAVAKLQAKDIDRVVGRSSVLASRIWRACMSQAQASKRKLITGTRVRDPDPELVQAAVDELTDVMAFAFLLRKRLGKKRRSASKGIKLRLADVSTLHQDAARMADAFDLDLGKLKNKFEPTAGNAIKRSMSDVRDVMNDALSEATKEQLPTPDATALVIERLRDHGISPRSSAYVETLTRTHAAISYGAAAKLGFQDDVDLWGYTYYTVGDDRVRDEHALLDGVTRKKDDPFWERFWPPNGWNCRCQAVAIYDEDSTQTPVPDDAEVDDDFDGDFTDLLD